MRELGDRQLRIRDPEAGQRRELAACEALATLPASTIDVMFRSMENHDYAAGESLMAEGASADYLFFIAEGTADARSRRQDGTTRHIATFGPGDIVGEMAFMLEEPRSASVQAETDVRALALRAEDFDELAAHRPELGVVLTHLIAERLGEKDDDGLGGKVVGSYRIQRALARGSMGVVYEARDLRTNARVALKMMSYRLIYQPSGLKRFEREADILLTLDHPNVGRFYERFEALKTSFIAMEYYDGPTIASVLKRHGPLSEADTRLVLGQVASALQYLHARDVIHRDLKPDNMITGSDGLIRLTDFGLAKDLKPMTSTSTSGEHPFIGTPLYMAPEQISGHRVSAPADVYALGCVGLQLLGGRLPFDDANLATLIMSKMSYELPSAALIGAGISQELHDVLRRAVSQAAEDRTVDLARVASWGGPLPDRLLDVAATA
jgi:CRP-like cAMP-binding protein